MGDRGRLVLEPKTVVRSQSFRVATASKMSKTSTAIGLEALRIDPLVENGFTSQFDRIWCSPPATQILPVHRFQR